MTSSGFLFGEQHNYALQNVSRVFFSNAMQHFQKEYILYYKYKIKNITNLNCFSNESPVYQHKHH